MFPTTVPHGFFQVISFVSKSSESRVQQPTPAQSDPEPELLFSDTLFGLLQTRLAKCSLNTLGLEVEESSDMISLDQHSRVGPTLWNGEAVFPSLWAPMDHGWHYEEADVTSRTWDGAQAMDTYPLKSGHP